MTFDYFFWFSQPSSILGTLDLVFGYFFAALFAVGILLLPAKRLVRHEVVRVLVRKFMVKDLVIGLTGLIWFGMRYENIPIFARRFWAGFLVLILAVWVIWILKYLAFDFFKAKKEFDQLQLKSKYMPGRK
ncbi:MAG: hypothetical protein HYV13_01675 [Candidatus Doudnabacteria bacterium]|nr:hypothetical protein [Candidatus Doudnabacteria bacterium]